MATIAVSEFEGWTDDPAESWFPFGLGRRLRSPSAPQNDHRHALNMHMCRLSLTLKSTKDSVCFAVLCPIVATRQVRYVTPRWRHWIALLSCVTSTSQTHVTNMSNIDICDLRNNDLRVRDSVNKLIKFADDMYLSIPASNVDSR